MPHGTGLVIHLAMLLCDEDQLMSMCLPCFCSQHAHCRPPILRPNTMPAPSSPASASSVTSVP